MLTNVVVLPFKLKLVKVCTLRFYNDLVRRCMMSQALVLVVVDTCVTIIKTLFRSSTQVVDACLHQQHCRIGVEYTVIDKIFMDTEGG